MLSKIAKTSVFVAGIAFMVSCQLIVSPDLNQEDETDETEEIPSEGRDEDSPVAESRDIFPKSVLFNEDTVHEYHKDLSVDEIINIFYSTRRSYSTNEDASLEWDPVAPQSPDTYDMKWLDFMNDETHKFRIESNPSMSLEELEPGAYVFGVRQKKTTGEWSGYHTTLDDTAIPDEGWWILHRPTEIDGVISNYLSYDEDEEGNDDAFTAHVIRDDLETFIDEEWRKGNSTNAQLSMMVDLYKNGR